MPHSSGGGSHGGGSHGGHGGGHHGGGFGRGGSGGGRSSSTAFPGSHRYVYYNKKTKLPVITYANYDMRRTSPILWIIMAIYSPTFFSILCMLVVVNIQGHHAPFKLKLDYDTKIVIDDRADVMTDDEEEMLIEHLEDFQDETGITPAVITVHNEDWDKQMKGTYLEDYAYKLYVKAFNDEKHWLIVYSEPEEPDPSFDDWYWEGMQGDDTDRILGRKETKLFNERLQKDLLRSDKYTVAEAMADSFDKLTPVAMKWYLEPSALIVSGVLLAFILVPVAVVVLVLTLTRKDKTKTFRCDDDVIRQGTCEYCGGVYIIGHQAHCPYCAAALNDN